MKISYKTEYFLYMSKTQVSTSENLKQFMKKNPCFTYEILNCTEFPS